MHHLIEFSRQLYRATVTTILQLRKQVQVPFSTANLKVLLPLLSALAFTSYWSLSSSHMIWFGLTLWPHLFHTPLLKSHPYLSSALNQTSISPLLQMMSPTHGSFFLLSPTHSSALTKIINDLNAS